MMRMTKLIVIGACVVMLGGCSASSSSSKSDTAAAPAAAVPVPASSPLSKVTLGMTKRQVKDVLGPSTDENSYLTGKAFIPFYFGTDARRTSWYYKGIGRVVFADGNVFGGGGLGEVIRVDYDPNESGVAREG